MNETEAVVYECGCEVCEDGVIEPCETAKRLFDEEEWEAKLDEHYHMQECSAKA